VLDVLCAYLRRPFDHERYARHRAEDDGAPYGPTEKRDVWDRERIEEAERELQVRLSIQRVIEDLLPGADEVDPPIYSLDLTGAVLEYFQLRNVQVGSVVLRYAKLHSSNDFSGTIFHRNLWLTEARSLGGRLTSQFLMEKTVVHGKAWFSGFTAEGRVLLNGSAFRGPTKFSNAHFKGVTDFTNCTFTETPLLDGLKADRADLSPLRKTVPPNE
jgi:hypothetical protein